MSNYLDAPQTRLLATHCVACGRPLCDATSVELGIGPECRGGDASGSGEANKLVYRAAIASQQGKIQEVLTLAEEIRGFGFPILADKVAQRFTNVRPDIEIEEKDGYLYVKTPFKRGQAEKFVKQWRSVPGRKFEHKRNIVPVSQRQRVYDILRTFFAGYDGIGPKGLFRVPTS